MIGMSTSAEEVGKAGQVSFRLTIPWSEAQIVSANSTAVAARGRFSDLWKLAACGDQ
jgi:hypothetical protein